MLGLAGLVLSLSAAQNCPAGQVVNEDTQGNCCWPEQAWSVTRGVCVGTPSCPAGFAVSGASCVPLAAVPSPAVAEPPPPALAPPPPPPMPQPGSDVPKLSGEARLVKHLQLTSELAGLKRDLERQTWIASFVVAGAVGGGLWVLGYVLNVVFLAVLPQGAAGYAAFWTFFGCALGGSITFTVLSIVGTVQLVRWIVLRSRIKAKRQELEAFDRENGIPIPPEGRALHHGPSPTLMVMSF